MLRTPAENEDLRRRIAAIESWYHRIDLGDGVETPGPLRMADFLRWYHLPERMDGLRVLDVGTSNGFFAYEFERRGADEVVAVELPGWADHDWTPRYRREFEKKSVQERRNIDRVVMDDGFELVGRALGSRRVRRIRQTIYRLDPRELGTFDVVFSGAMLMHVRDPILGLQRLRACCKPAGRLIVSISTLLTGSQEPLARFAGRWDECNWWQMSSPALRAVLASADFDRVENEETYVLADVTGRFQDPTFVCHALPRLEAGANGVERLTG